MSSDELNTLPEGWELVKFDDLFNITSSKRVHKKDWVSEGVPFYRAREIVKISNNGFVDNELFITKKMFDEFNEKYGSPEEDDILVTGVGTLGICYIVKPNDKFYFKDGNIIWFKKKVEVESRYIEYGFQSDYIRNQVYSGGGSTVATYTIIRAKNTTIPLPSLEEQKRIVAKIDTLFAKIDKAISLTEESLKQAKSLLPSVLKEVFETMDGVEKYLPNLTKEGRYSIKRGPFGSSLKKQFFVPSGYKVYEQKHAIKNDFEIGEYFVNEEKFFELKAFELKPRDIIISCSGTIGKIAVAPHNIIPGIINQALLKISLNEDEIEIPFFTYWFNNYVNNGSLSTKGAAIKNIVSVKELKTIPIKVPNLNKQKEICDKLDRYLQLSNQTQSKLEGQLAYLKQLKSSILSKAFKGEL